MRRNQALRGDVSAEMALELRSSLATISDYARKLASNYDQKSAEQLATDIAVEADLLQRNIGGFLAAGKASGTASGMN
jgi:signal transduction histidine kinase